MFEYAFYLFKVIICSGIFFGYYWLALRNKVFHRYNRFYILATVVLSLVLPLIKINIWHAGNADASAIILLQAMNSSDAYLDEVLVTVKNNNITAEQIVTLFYVITSVFFLSIFIYGLIRIRKLFLKHEHRLVENIFLVNTTTKGTPFSFLRYIFWNDLIDPESPTGNQVFRHELAHVQQRHSYDKLFMNLLLAFCWCNPFFWLAKKELDMIHEFTADKIAVEDSDTQAFAAMILQATYPRHQFQFTNPFFYSPIKRRMMMLSKNKNPRVGYFGRLLALPLAFFIFAAFTLKAKHFKSAPVYNGKTFTVVLDAGHGGDDHGAINTINTIFEKDLTLAISKQIKLTNNNSQVNIILTRESDISQSLQDKIDFTIDKKADLFVSIHTDANPTLNASGLSVSIAKDPYQHVASSRVFASALINEFMNGYGLPVTPQPLQRQASIKVLQSAPCPAVLIETGNIANEKDLQYLQSTEGIQTIANKVLNAIEKYALAGETAMNSNTGIKTITDTVPITIQQEEPMIFVDGKAISKDEMEKIDNKQIESVNVLKDAYAIEKYGEKGRNGVILIRKKTTTTSQKNAGIKLRKQDANVTSKNKTKAADNILLNLAPENQPLYVLNGKLQPKSFLIKSILPGDIESINVLKGESATKKYGSTAVNGVVEITTKNKKIVKELT